MGVKFSESKHLKVSIAMMSQNYCDYCVRSDMIHCIILSFHRLEFHTYSLAVSERTVPTGDGPGLSDGGQGRLGDARECRGGRPFCRRRVSHVHEASAATYQPDGLVSLECQ